MFQLHQGFQFGGPGGDGAKVNKGCGVKVGFLKDIAICTSQTNGLKKGVAGSQTPFLRQLSDELGVKVSETSGSHFPLNSQEHRGEKTMGLETSALPKPPPQLKWLQVLSPGTCGWALHPGQGQVLWSHPQWKMGPCPARQDGSPGTPGEGKGGAWADVNYMLPLHPSTSDSGERGVMNIQNIFEGKRKPRSRHATVWWEGRRQGRTSLSFVSFRDFFDEALLIECESLRGHQYLHTPLTPFLSDGRLTRERFKSNSSTGSIKI